MRAFGHKVSKVQRLIQLRLTAKLSTPSVCCPHPALRATFPQGKVLYIFIVYHFPQQISRWAAMVRMVSPSWVRITPSRFSSSTLRPQAMVLAKAVTAAVSSQAFIISPPGQTMLKNRRLCKKLCSLSQNYRACILPSLPCLKGGGPQGRRDSVALGRHAAKAAISPSQHS